MAESCLTCESILLWIIRASETLEWALWLDINRKLKSGSNSTKATQGQCGFKNITRSKKSSNKLGAVIVLLSLTKETHWDLNVLSTQRYNIIQKTRCGILVERMKGVFVASNFVFFFLYRNLYSFREQKAVVFFLVSLKHLFIMCHAG